MSQINSTVPSTLEMIRKVYPGLLAHQIIGVQQIVGVQPMQSATSTFKLVFKKDKRVWSKKKYQFSRTKWYEAQISDWSRHHEVLVWCAEHFGPHPTQPDAWSRWYPGAAAGRIMFRDEKDFIWYTLRWS